MYRSCSGKSTAKKKKSTLDDDVLCGVCTEMMTSAVLLPCCAGAACDMCAREYLIENDNVCPLCKETNQSPEEIVPALGVRIKVAKLGGQVQIIVPALGVRIKVAKLGGQVQIIVPALGIRIKVAKLVGQVQINHIKSSETPVPLPQGYWSSVACVLYKVFIL